MIKQIKPFQIIVCPNSKMEKTGIVFGEDENEDLLYWEDSGGCIYKLNKKPLTNYKILKPKKYTIYAITNDVNDKIYIGKTSKELENRMYQHLRIVDLNIDNRPLYKDMREYGKEHFKIQSLVEIYLVYDFSENIETYMINKLNTKHPNGYNILNQYFNDFYYFWHYIYDFKINTKNEQFRQILTNYFINEMKFYEKWEQYNVKKIRNNPIEYYTYNSTTKLEIYRINEQLNQENQKLKDRWNKLKEYITKERDLNLNASISCGDCMYSNAVMFCEELLDKMQELEKENQNER